MRYFNYYRLLTLKQTNRMGFGYAMLFIIVYLVQWNLLFSEPGVSRFRSMRFRRDSIRRIRSISIRWLRKNASNTNI